MSVNNEFIWQCFSHERHDILPPRPTITGYIYLSPRIERIEHRTCTKEGEFRHLWSVWRASASGSPNKVLWVWVAGPYQKPKGGPKNSGGVENKSTMTVTVTVTVPVTVRLSIAIFSLADVCMLCLVSQSICFDRENRIKFSFPVLGFSLGCVAKMKTPWPWPWPWPWKWARFFTQCSLSLLKQTFQSSTRARDRDRERDRGRVCARDHDHIGLPLQADSD
jgi:hypothetical protein